MKREMARIQAEMQEVMKAEKNLSKCWKMHLGGLVMGLTKYKLGDLIEQKEEKYNGEKNFQHGGFQERDLFHQNKMEQIHLYIMCFIKMISCLILQEWNLIQ